MMMVMIMVFNKANGHYCFPWGSHAILFDTKLLKKEREDVDILYFGVEGVEKPVRSVCIVIVNHLLGLG